MTNVSLRRPIILDVDTGIDDAWALVYAARSPRLDVLAVTTVFGNASLDTTTRNTLSMLDLIGVDIPVFRGAAQPLLRVWDGPVAAYHGHNGMGEAEMPEPRSQTQTLDAAEYIVQTVRQRPHEVTLVTVARLTNIARALLYDPDIAALIPRIIMMGGAAFCPGNVTAVAEANIWGDPEAADFVFHSGVPITMVGLDVTMQARLSRRHLALLNPHLAYSRVLSQATEFYIAAYERDTPDLHDWCPVHDALAVAAAEDPTLIATRRYPVRVECRGQYTDGMTVVDARSGETTDGADVAVHVEASRFLEVFYQRVGIETATTQGHRSLGPV